jgi:hypothetical protein
MATIDLLVILSGGGASPPQSKDLFTCDNAYGQFSEQVMEHDSLLTLHSRLG